jgi:hypothetical protein
MIRLPPLPHDPDTRTLARYAKDKDRNDRKRHDVETRIALTITGDEAIAFAGAGSLTLHHHLRRLPRGWRIVDIDANQSVWRNAWTSSTITLEASGAVNIRVEVF